jgi:hypothetical protein
MSGLSLHRRMLIHRLAQMGMDSSSIPGLVWSLKSCFQDNPELTQSEINRRLESLGWYGFKLDDFTLKLAYECFKTEADQLSQG